MDCLGSPDFNTSLHIEASFIGNLTSSSSDGELSGLRPEGIAGISVACVVAFLFILGLTISLKGTLWFKNICKCCKNKTQALTAEEESPRANGSDVERKDTGLAGSATEAIGHQPSNHVSIQPSASKDNLRPDIEAMTDLYPIMGTSLALQELNSTGQNLLANNAKQSHEEPHGPDVQSYDSNDGASTDHHLLPASLLPNIHANNAPAAQIWN